MDIDRWPRRAKSCRNKENKIRVACVKGGVTSEATTGIACAMM